MNGPPVPTHVQNAGTTSERIVTPRATPLHRRRVTAATPQDVERIVNQLQEDVHQATLGARSLPMPVVLEAVAFTSGVSLRLNHRMPTSRVGFELVDANMLTAGSPCASRISVDETSMTILPAGTFVADVRFTVKP